MSEDGRPELFFKLRGFSDEDARAAEEARERMAATIYAACVPSVEALRGQIVSALVGVGRAAENAPAFDVASLFGVTARRVCGIAEAVASIVGQAEACAFVIDAATFRPPLAVDYEVDGNM